MKIFKDAAKEFLNMGVKNIIITLVQKEFILQIRRKLFYRCVKFER